MVFGLFKKKDPVCSMKEEKNKGLNYEGNWFCSKNCKEQYLKQQKDKPKSGCGCCH